jgi:SAM-dependent methyltransferase
MVNVRGQECFWLASPAAYDHYYTHLYSEIPEGTIVGRASGLDQWILAESAALLPLASAIDIGHNYGKHLGIFRYEYGIPAVTGCDVVPRIREIARDFLRRYYPGQPEDITWDVGKFETLPYRDQQFDLVLASNVLEHVPDWQPAFEKVLAVTRRRALVAIPKDRSFDWSEDHLHLFTATEAAWIRDRAAACGFAVDEQVIPFEEDPAQSWYCWCFDREENLR